MCVVCAHGVFSDREKNTFSQYDPVRVRNNINSSHRRFRITRGCYRFSPQSVHSETARAVIRIIYHRVFLPVFVFPASHRIYSRSVSASPSFPLQTTTSERFFSARRIRFRIPHRAAAVLLLRRRLNVRSILRT